MAKKRANKDRRRPSNLRWVTGGAAILIVLGLAAFWWRSEAPSAAGGTPRLVVHRTEIDLGRFPFEATARAEFTLTNAGDGVLQLADVPQVIALKGC